MDKPAMSSAQTRRIKDAQRQNPWRQFGIAMGQAPEHLIAKVTTDQDQPLSPRAELGHPQEIFQHQRIDDISRLQRLDDALARPFILWIKPQRLAKMLSRLLGVTLMQQRPALVCMREGELSGFLASAASIVLPASALRPSLTIAMARTLVQPTCSGLNCNPCSAAFGRIPPAAFLKMNAGEQRDIDLRPPDQGG